LKDYETFKRLDDPNGLVDLKLLFGVEKLVSADALATPVTGETPENLTQREKSVQEKRNQVFRELLQGKEVFDFFTAAGQEERKMVALAKKYVEFASRLAFGLFGGFALIVPMLIMDLHPTKLTSLLTTSVFVVALAITLAVTTTWEPKDIIASTAAYAAVLVVFVGVSNPIEDLGNAKIGGIVAGTVAGLYMSTMFIAYIRAGPLLRRYWARRVLNY
jgi:ABC-type multidrug transport system fused ATPase/permease subunit